MAIGVDHIHLKAREEAMRANALKNAESIAANADKDKKFFLITLGALAAVIVGLVLCMVIPWLIAG